MYGANRKIEELAMMKTTLMMLATYGHTYFDSGDASAVVQMHAVKHARNVT